MTILTHPYILPTRRVEKATATVFEDPLSKALLDRIQQIAVHWAIKNDDRVIAARTKCNNEIHPS